MKTILIFILSVYYSYAFYCIQIASYTKINKQVINDTKKLLKLNLKQLRLEKRNKYYVLRSGRYFNVSAASNDLKKIKKLFPSAFIRKCEIKKEKIILYY